MKAIELISRIEQFRNELKEHAELWKTSHDPYLPDYPIANGAKLREQMDRLARQLGALYPLMKRMEFPTTMSMVGVEWDIYQSAVSNDLAIRKGHSLEAVFSQLQQALGRLDSMDPNDEFPARAHATQQQPQAAAPPVTIYNLQGAQSRVNVQSTDRSTNLGHAALGGKSAGQKKRFAVDAEVRVTMPGVNGVVTQLDDEPTVLGEYWHTIKTKHGERREPGCNLQLIPKAQS
jgi:hypothetical protein